MKATASFRVTLLFLMLFSGHFLSAQNKRMDSLYRELKKNKDDTVKVNTLNALAAQQTLISEYDSALKYNQAALLLATHLDFRPGVVGAYFGFGAVHSFRGNYPEALDNYFKAIKLLDEKTEKKSLARAYNNIGIIYKNMGNYPDALKTYFQSLKIREDVGDEKGMASSYNNIGNVYDNQGNYVDALKYFSLSLNIKEKLKDTKGISSTRNNIGNVYQRQRNYSEALKNYNLALETDKARGDKRSVASDYNNIGTVFFEQGNQQEAIQYFNQALEIREVIGDKQGMISSLQNLGNTYMKSGSYSQARTYLNQSLQIAEELNYKAGLVEIHKSLSKLDSTLGNFKGAFLNFQMYILYRDSVFSEENTKKTVQAQMSYEFAKKSAADSVKNVKDQEIKNEQIRARDTQLDQEKKQRYTLYGGLLLVLIFSGFLFNRFRVTQKQKKVIELQKVLVEEKQKEILDSISYAKRLQLAILPPISLIEKAFPESFVLYKPKDIVAGDFYWFEEKNGFRFLAAADCTGHGVPGAMVSVVCSNALHRAVVEMNLTDPGKILDKVTELVLETFEKSGESVKDGMDISLISLESGVLSSEKVIAKWSGANNPLWYIQRNSKEVKVVSGDKQPIGQHDNRKPFTTHVLEIEKGDTVFLLTDGYADQFGGPKGKKFKYKALSEKLIEINSGKMTEQLDELERILSSWKGSLEQVDDITIIGIRV